VTCHHTADGLGSLFQPADKCYERVVVGRPPPRKLNTVPTELRNPWNRFPLARQEKPSPSASR
jgi:hypothetical protein